MRIGQKKKKKNEEERERKKERKKGRCREKRTLVLYVEAGGRNKLVVLLVF